MGRGTRLRSRVVAYVGPLLACVWAGLLLANVDLLFAPLPAPPALPAALVAPSSCRPHRVRLLYTLLNAEASGSASRRWDFGALEQLFLSALLARLAPLASFEVRSQIVHYGGVEGAAPNSMLSRSQVDGLRASLEERTHADVGTSAAGGELVLNFLAVVPAAAAQPLRLNASGAGVVVDGWGGVTMLNTLCSKSGSAAAGSAALNDAACALEGGEGAETRAARSISPRALSAPEAGYVAEAFAAQLNAIPWFARNLAGDGDELESLERRALHEHGACARARLLAVHARHIELRGAVDDHVVADYARASELLRLAFASPPLPLAEALVLARRASAAAHDADSGARAVGRSIMNTQHLASIFLPLLLPLAIPVMRAVKQELSTRTA